MSPDELRARCVGFDRERAAEHVRAADDEVRIGYAPPADAEPYADLAPDDMTEAELLNERPEEHLDYYDRSDYGPLPRED